MKLIQLTIAIGLATVACLQSERAFSLPQTLAQQPTSEQILSACAASQSDTLPIPFSDLEPNLWAFPAVMELYYCGPFSEKENQFMNSGNEDEQAIKKLSAIARSRGKA